MDNCWLSCQVMADMKKVYDDLIIINLYEWACILDGVIKEVWGFVVTFFKRT